MKIKLFFIVLFLESVVGFSQTQEYENPVNKIFSGTPDVSAFHKFGFSPTNLYSGRAEIEIPLYEITSGDIKVPITLNYNTSGNKLEDIASNVGLGWSLFAGGNIIHMVKGIPDDEMYIKAVSGGGENFYDVETLGYHRRDYDYDNTKDEVGNSLPNNETYGRRYSNFIDSSPDLYHVAAPGMNAKFIVVSDDPTEDNTVNRGNQNFFSRSFRSIFLDNNTLKMDDASLHYSTYDAPNILAPEYSSIYGPDPANWQQYHQAKYLDNFKIRNKNGLVYTFEIGDVSETDTEVASGFGLQSQNYNKRVTSWNLSSIVNPVTNKEVSFEYEVYPNTVVENITSINNAWIVNDQDYFFENTSGLNPKNTVMKKVYPRLTRLKKIVFDKGSVEFKYNNYYRLDYHDKSLSQVIIKDYNGNLIKRYQLIYDYFTSKENCTKRECYRLKLVGLRQFVSNHSQIEDQTYLNVYTFEYNEANELPNRLYSLEKDYLGYYNNNGAGYLQYNPDDDMDNYLYNYSNFNPVFYYYPDQYELSVLPFKKQNISSGYIRRPLSVNQGSSLEPDFDATLITSLKKINYPTGGFLNLFYTNNEFHFEGHDYAAPGLRVQRQEMDDGKGNIEVFEYEYEDVNGNSSGTFVNIPVFCYPTKEFNTQNGIPQDYNGFNFFMSPKSGYELTNGSFIGYSRIKKAQVGNGYTIYNYTSPKDKPNIKGNRYGAMPSVYNDFLIKNSAFPGQGFVNEDIKRGRLLQKEIYDNDSNLIYKETREHTYKKFDSISTRFIGEYTFFTYRKWRFNDYVDFKKETTSLTPFSARIIEDSKIYQERNLETEIKKEFISSAGTLEELTTISYDNNYPFPKVTTLESNSLGNSEHTEYKYPYEYSTSEMDALVDFNIISTPIETKKIKNGKTSFLNNNYTLINSLPYPLSIGIRKELEPEKIIVAFEGYDEANGNLLEYISESGIRTVVIWGYNYSLPIAKVENAVLSDIPTSVYNNIISTSNSNNDYNLRTELDKLRDPVICPNLSDAMVTTYTYDPLVGVTSITDPKGYTTYYEYDDFNRLEQVIDAEGYILSENEYNYKQ